MRAYLHAARLVVPVALAVVATESAAQRPAPAPAPAVVAPRFVIVAHPGVRDTVLTRSQASRLFLKQSRTWPSGATARPVDLRRDASARLAFVQAVHQRRPAAVEAYWQQQIFSGRDTPPPARPDDGAVIAYVRSTPGAVGYVSARTPPGAGVRMVALIP